MGEKPVTWQQGIAVIGGAFGICCLGFMLLHGMIVSDRAEAASNLKSAVADRNVAIKAIIEDIHDYQKQNTQDHKEIMSLLVGIRKAQ